MNKILCGLLFISIAFIGIGAVAAADVDHFNGDFSTDSNNVDFSQSLCSSDGFPYDEFPSAPNHPKNPGIGDPWDGQYRPLHPEKPYNPLDPFNPFNPYNPRLA